MVLQPDKCSVGVAGRKAMEEQLGDEMSQAGISAGVGGISSLAGKGLVSRRM